MTRVTAIAFMGAALVFACADAATQSDAARPGDGKDGAGTPDDAGASDDAGDPDTGPPDDAAIEDAGAADAGGADAEAADAGDPDGGTTDASTVTDAGTADAAQADTGTSDAGTVDAGTTTTDGGASDAGVSDAGSALDEDPIVFVHGWLWNAKDWSEFIDYFRGLGYPDDHLAAIQFNDTAGSNVKDARDELAPFVADVLAKTGKSRVDIIGHSMAGLSVRLYILKYGGKDTIRDVFLLAPTNHGGTEACLVTFLGEGAKEMCPAYAAQDKSVNGVQWDLNGDPGSDDVDETPFCVAHGAGELFYTTVRDGKDTFAVPHDTACLNQKSRADCSDPLNLDPGWDLGHFGLLHDPRVFELAAQRLRAHNPGRPR